MPAATSSPSSQLAAELRKAGLTEVDDSTRRRAEYSTDASLYRVVPQVVAFPRARRRGDRRARRLPDAGRAADRPRRRHVDRRQLRRHRPRARLLPAPQPGPQRRPGSGHGHDRARHRAGRPAAGGEAGRAAVRPGPVHAQPLHARRHDRQQRVRLPGARLRPHLGQRRRARRDHRHRRAPAPPRQPAAPRRSPSCRRSSARNLATIRTELGRFGRQVSGYSLEHLLPERGFDVARALVGTEGTLAVVLGATVRTGPHAAGHRADRARLPGHGHRRRRRTGAAAVRADRRRGPGQADRRRRRGHAAGRARCPTLPTGTGWLFVELAGATEAEVLATAPRR